MDSFEDNGLLNDFFCSRKSQLYNNNIGGSIPTEIGMLNQLQQL
jgi:hypothetical protein